MANVNRTRVKICGITRMEDAAAAALAGADAIGLVFYAGSPRCVSAAQARQIVTGCPPFVAKVGLFVDAEPAFVQSVLDEIPLDLLQFHGRESPDTCASFRRPYIKAVPVRPGVDIRAAAAPYGAAAGILLDTWVEGMAGGTGRRFDWDSVPRGLARPLILAGGLEPGNVAAAIRAVRPFAVDVSGGVEVSPGIKDAGKIAELLAAARAA